MSQLDFQDFQQAFARHIRDPHHTARPAGVPARRMAVYNELLFNNLTGFLDTCFPVCRKLLGEAPWRRLNRTFFRDWKSSTPWFREIPREFIRYLNDGIIHQRLPAWFTELAHYEWAELAVDIMDCPIPAHDPNGDLMTQAIVLNPARLDLSYAWAVHRIGPQHRPRQQQATQLIVYRDIEDAVQFVEINPVTSRLRHLLATTPSSGTDACRLIADELRHPDPQQLTSFGSSLLSDWRSQGIILGTQR